MPRPEGVSAQFGCPVAMRRRASKTACAHELMARRTCVHTGIMQNEILNPREFSRPPQRGAGVVKMGAQLEGFRDRAQAQALIQTRQRVGCRLQRGLDTVAARDSCVNSSTIFKMRYFLPSRVRFSTKS